jgi:hypothetical protein
MQISDFGLAKWLPEKWAHHVVFPIEGTFGLRMQQKFLISNFKGLKLSRLNYESFYGTSGIWLPNILCMALLTRKSMCLHLGFCCWSSLLVAVLLIQVDKALSSGYDFAYICQNFYYNHRT